MIATALWLLLGAILGALTGVAALLAYAKTRGGPALLKADEVLKQARAEAETLLKQSDLRAKEEAFRRRESVEAEAEVVRKELRERE